jgi:hypothetical protein
MYISGMVPVRCTPSTLGLLAGILLAAACGGERSGPRLPADFLLTTADTTYWVSSGPNGLRVRSAPILIARVDGRFRQLYSADVDRSYFDAVFVGQRLFSRDLVRGDSVQLMADTVVAALEQKFRKEHPNEQLLDSDEDTAGDPSISASASIDVLDVHGPYLSYEYHTDVDVKRSATNIDRHTGRRGVLDMRTHRPAGLAELFGDASAGRVLTGAAAEWASAARALAAHADSAGRAASDAARGFALDPASFSLDALDRRPQVVIAVPGTRSGSPTEPVALSPQSVEPPAWWKEVLPLLPTGTDSVRRWSQGSVQVTALTTDHDHARLMLRDGNARDWDLGLVTGPVQHLLWLDQSITADDRRALERAFDESASTSGATQVATRTPRSPYLNVYAKPTDAYGARVRAYQLRPDDADGRERPRARLRRDRAELDRQDRRGLRDAPRPRVGRDRVDG